MTEQRKTRLMQAIEKLIKASGARPMVLVIEMAHADVVAGSNVKVFGNGIPSWQMLGLLRHATLEAEIYQLTPTNPIQTPQDKQS